MPHYLFKKQLQNTDKKHIKKMKKYLVNTEKMRKYTQFSSKGLNNDLYNYRGGIFPMGGNTASFCLFLAGHTAGLWKERCKNGEREP